jgi:hypothetical protein
MAPPPPLGIGLGGKGNMRELTSFFKLKTLLNI